MRNERVLISGGDVLVSSDRQFGTQRADLLIEGSRIAAVGLTLDGGDTARRVDARGCYVLPGLVNAHTHAHNNLSRSLGDRWTLEQLRSRGPALYGGRSAEEQYLSAALGAAEMLRAGCTAAYDQFAALPYVGLAEAEAVVAAYRDTGIRAVLAPSVSDLPSHAVVPGYLERLSPSRRHEAATARPSADDQLDAVRVIFERWDGDGDGRIRIGLAPVIPGVCSDELLVGAAELMRELGLTAQTHLAESQVQALAARHRWGHSIVAQLDDCGLLGPNLVAGHAVWVDREDISRLADAGACVAHNPASNLRLGNGVAPVADMLAAGIEIGIGSDGCHSSDNQNMFEAMRAAGLASSTLFPYEPDNWLGAEDALYFATSGGARLLGQAGRIGELRPGFEADVVVLDGRSTYMSPANDVVNQLVYSQTGADVQHVFVAGRQVVNDGRLTTINEPELLRRCRRAGEEAKERVEEGLRRAAEMDAALLAACKAILEEAEDPDPAQGPTKPTTERTR